MFQQVLHASCVKQLMRAAAHLSLSLITPVIVFAVVGVISVTPAYAQDQASIDAFVGCLNSLPAGAGVDAAVACVPTSCFTTVTMSSESAQPACTLNDGTKLPRVIFSCQESDSATQRFRPSFSLCTSNSVINHIEVGEDSGVVVDTKQLQVMGDISLPTAAPLDSGVNGIQAGNGNTQTGCANCHDQLATVGGVNLFAPIRPALGDGTIYTNDPRVQAPAVQTPLSVICAGIQSSTYLAAHPAKQALASSLCTALSPRTP
jgi:hypothetical protein